MDPDDEPTSVLQILAAGDPRPTAQGLLNLLFYLGRPLPAFPVAHDEVAGAALGRSLVHIEKRFDLFNRLRDREPVEVKLLENVTASIVSRKGELPGRLSRKELRCLPRE